MRRFRSEWKEAVKQHVSRMWHVAEYRYFDIRNASRQELTRVALIAYRDKLNSAYREAIKHKRSKKAIEQVYVNARSLASIAQYQMEREA